MSEPSDRRTFLKRSAVAASALAAGCAPGDDSAADRASAPSLPAETLLGLADVVLPSELGTDGIARVASDFQRWVGDNAPVAEQVHGYGSQEIRYGPPDPAPRWAAQLDALETEARQRHRSGFHELTVDDRRALIESALGTADASLGGRPGALAAEHVAVGLLGYYFGSPEASNLCYGRRIDALGCRPLADSPREPEPLEPRSAGRNRPARGGLVRRSPGEGASIEPGLEPGS